jgi:cysteinyl-tRNA synthetase
MPVAGQGVPPEVWEQAVEAAGRKAGGKADVPPQEVLDLVEQRQQARQRKDWAAADALRKRIEALGWRVEDGKDGVKLRRRID